MLPMGSACACVSCLFVESSLSLNGYACSTAVVPAKRAVQYTGF